MIFYVPTIALRAMKKAAAAGNIHSRQFESQYGWLCGRYRASCYYYEILFLVARLATMACMDTLGDKLDGLLAAAFCIVISVVLLMFQLQLKPFLEHDDSPSQNSMAELGYVCTIVVLLCGSVSVIAKPSGVFGVVIAVVTVVGLFLPLVRALTAKPKSVKDDDAAEASVVPNPVRVVD
jgi:hypothetical protein